MNGTTKTEETIQQNNFTKVTQDMCGVLADAASFMLMVRRTYLAGAASYSGFSQCKACELLRSVNASPEW